jgi:hypothetical protein
MKRMLGVFFVAAGAAAVVWGAYYVMTGKSDTVLYITDDFSVSALTGGLAGVGLFTFGLIWVRD